MRKKIWILIGIITAFATGNFLFQSMMLLFRYHERRQGVFLLMSGLAVGVLYAWSFYQSSGNTKRMEQEPAEYVEETLSEKHIWNMILSAVAFGSAATGLVLYWMRYRGTITIIISIVSFAFTYAVVSAVVIWLINWIHSLEKER